MIVVRIISVTLREIENCCNSGVTGVVVVEGRTYINCGVLVIMAVVRLYYSSGE